MKRNLPHIISLAGSGWLGVMVVGCGGGGTSPSPGTPATPTPPPPAFACTSSVSIQNIARRRASSLRLTSSATRSTFTFDSNPRGLAVFVNSTLAGSTTFSTVPAYGDQPYTGAIRGPVNSFGVCYAQLADGSHTIFYNTASDTQGRLGQIAAATAARQSIKSVLTGVGKVPPRPAAAPAYDTTRIEVRFFTASIRGDERAAAAIERKGGAPAARTLGPVHDGVMTRIVSIPATETAQSFAARFRTYPEVADARPLPLRFVSASAPVSPNDPGFNTIDQWDFFRTSMPNAWGYSVGNAARARRHHRHGRRPDAPGPRREDRV
jgi:hypothetical protein